MAKAGTKASQLQWHLIASRDAGLDDGDDSLVRPAIQGDFSAVLSSSPARALLSPLSKRIGFTLRNHASSSSSSSSADSSLDASLTAALVTLSDDIAAGIASLPSLDEASQLFLLCVAASLLHAFVQLNWTGPDLQCGLTPAHILRQASPDDFPLRSAGLDDDPLADLDKSLSRVALDKLTLAGEPAYHLCKSPFFLVLAESILEALAARTSSSPTQLQTIAWWRLRASGLHSRILDDFVPVAAPILSGVDGTIAYLAGQAAGQDDDGVWASLHSQAILEKGLALQRASQDREASERFVEAAKSNGLLYHLTGAPGKRTKFQKEEKNILVLLAESKSSVDVKEGADEAAEKEPDSDQAEAAAMPTAFELNDEVLLERTQFTSTVAASPTSSSPLSHVDPNKPSPLAPLDACILLALSLNITNTSPAHGLTASEISAFVSRVLAHPVNWSVYTVGLLLRSRLESTRTRTAERAVLQLQALLDQMPTSDSTVSERLRYFHALDLPASWELQAELAKLYAALGVIRSALEIYERLELWEEAVQCLGYMGRQEEGIDIVRDLLQGSKVEAPEAIAQRKKDQAAPRLETRTKLSKARKAKLWCVLGDLEPDKAEEHYLVAWDVSERSSSRAARSVGAVCFAQSRWGEATEWLRRALRISPLYTRSWFTLGCAYVRLERWEEATRAFRRCTSLDDEDGESWNNLASCYLRLGEAGARAGGVVAPPASDREDAIEQEDQAALLGDEDDERMETSSVATDATSSTATMRTAGADSGVAVSDTSTEVAPDDNDEDAAASAPTYSSRPLGSTPYELTLLAHRALARSLKFSHDSWRVWSNYMLVSIDAGILSEAVRAMRRLVEICSSPSAGVVNGSEGKHSLANERKLIEVLDLKVLHRLVGAVTRSPQLDPSSSSQASSNPNEGAGLFPSLLDLFETSLLPRISSSPDLFKAYARLLLWAGDKRSSLDASLNAWRVSQGGSNPDEGLSVAIEDEEQFEAALEHLTELCETLENYGPTMQQRGVAARVRRVAAGGVTGAGRRLGAVVEEDEGDGAEEEEEVMPNWAFKARSLVRAFMGRTKADFEDSPAWHRVEELRDSFKK